MRHLIYIFLVLRLCGYSQSLNLIPNPSFEELTAYDCSINYNFSYVSYWYNPTQCSPDIWEICEDQLFPNAIDNIKRHSGTNRAGIFVYDSTHINQNVREYLANKLIDTLLISKKYCFNVYIVPRKEFKYGTDKFGVFFGNDHQNYSVGCNFIPVTPQLSLPNGVFISDTANWYNFQGIYTAQGGETDIALGSFSDDANTNLLIIDPNSNAEYSYFIIDDVSLYEMSLNAGADALTCSKNLVATIGEANGDTAFKSYYWYDANNTLIDSTHAQLTVAPSANTFYIEEKRMCGQSFFDTVYVNIADLCPEVPVVIPNVFSPNDDGINDNFEFTEQYSQINTFRIFNRWGVKVYDIADELSTLNATLSTISWDGHTTSGEPCNEGVYYYILEFTNQKQEVETYRGYVSLFR